MNYRRSLLLAEENFASAGTKTIDIKTPDVISRLVLSWRVAKVLEGMTSYAHKDITKIELVDGSDVLHSTDGGLNQALCIFDRKAPTMNHGQHLAGNSEFSTFGIDFGRFLFDPTLALDPKKFNNLQLKITHNFAVADTSATSGNLEVWADIFDEKIVAPMGFLMAKNHYSYTPGAANSYEYIQLPTDFPLRRLLIQGYRAGYAPWDQIIQAKLDEDNDKRVLYDMDLEDWHRFRKGIDQPIQEEFEGVSDATARIFYLTPTDYYATLLTQSIQTLTATPGYSSWGPGGKFTITANAYSSMMGMAHGWCPNHCFNIPFGNPDDPADWYDVTKLSSLRLRLMAGSSGASGSGAVVIQQLRKY